MSSKTPADFNNAWFKNAITDFLCNKTMLQLIHSTNSLPSSWLFQNYFVIQRPKAWLHSKETELFFLYLEMVMLLFLTAS